MFIRKIVDKEIFSLREKFLDKLNKELKEQNIELTEKILRENLKKRLDKGTLM